MKITITFHCSDCQSAKIKKNGKKASGKQNYLCKNCFRQFKRILLMLVRGIGIRDISVIQEVSVRKVVSVPVNSHHLKAFRLAVFYINYG
jgi:hypothetical protein